MLFVIEFIHLVAWLFTILVIVNTFISYFMTPYHPVRLTLDRIVGPFLAPIRRIVPPVGMIDFSPVVLIILIQIVEFVLTRLLALIR